MPTLRLGRRRARELLLDEVPRASRSAARGRHHALEPVVREVELAREPGQRDVVAGMAAAAVAHPAAQVLRAEQPLRRERQAAGDSSDVAAPGSCGEISISVFANAIFIVMYVLYATLISSAFSIDVS